MAKNTQKCFNCREGNLDQGDDLIPGSRIHNRLRRDQLKDNAKEGNNSSSSKDSAIFRKPFRGYTKTLQGQCSDCVTHSGVTQSLPGAALRVWMPTKVDAEAFRGFRG